MKKWTAKFILSSLALVSALLLLCFITTGLHAQTNYYSLTVQSGPLRQSFSGFGCSHVSTIWSNIPTSYRTQMVDMVYRDLKMNTIRLWVTTTGTNKTTPPPLISVSQMLGEFYTNHILSGVINDCTNHGINTLLLAPAQFGAARPASISDYATNLAELIFQIKINYGINIDVTGLSNEPEDSSGGTNRWSPEQLATLINYLRPALDSRSLTNVKIIAPESSSAVTASGSLSQICTNVTAWSNLWGIASHSYNSVMVNNNMELLKNGKPWWMTESSGDDNYELEEDENYACTILARFNCDLNHGVDKWLYFIGFGEEYSVTNWSICTSFLMLYDRHAPKIWTFLRYFYFKQAVNTFDTGCVFRQCTSATEGDMFIQSGGNASAQNPGINAAAAYNPDGSWGINIVNNTGVNNSLTNFAKFYQRSNYSVTITVQELTNTASLVFTNYRSSANVHFVYSGTITFTNGVGTVSIAPRELVSLRSVAMNLTNPPAPNGLYASTYNAPVALNWNNTMGATSWKVKRATVSGGPYTIIANTTTTSYRDTAALNGIVYYYVVSAMNSAGESANSSEVVCSPAPFPWTNVDIGAVGRKGSLKVWDNGVFSTYAAGVNLGTTNDSFNYTYTTMRTNGAIIARMTYAGHSNARVGIMMSETLGNSPRAAGVVYNLNGNRTQLFWRTTAGTQAQFSTSTLFTNIVPNWLKLVRTNNMFTGYASTNGTTWSAIYSNSIAMSNDIYVGLVSLSSNTNEIGEGDLDNISMPCSAPTGLAEMINISVTNIVLNWTACLGASNYYIKRATNSGGPYSTISTVSSPIITYTDNAIIPGANYYYTVSAVNATGESTNSSESVALWKNQDIGVVGIAGQGALSSGGIFTANGAGTNFGGTTDSFNYTYHTMNSNGTLIARMTSGNNANRVGIMMSEALSPAPRSAGVTYYFNPAYLKAQMFWRATAGGVAQWSSSTITNSSGFTNIPCWLKIERVGNMFTGFASSNGVNWAVIYSNSITMSNTIYVGLMTVSGKTNQLATGALDNLTESFPFGSGMARLASSSVISLSQPIITQMARTINTGLSLIIQGVNGTPGGIYIIVSQTNMAAPIASWWPVATNTFNKGGTFSNSIPITPDAQGAFFQIKQSQE